MVLYSSELLLLQASVSVSLVTLPFNKPQGISLSDTLTTIYHFDCNRKAFRNDYRGAIHNVTPQSLISLKNQSTNKRQILKRSTSHE